MNYALLLIVAIICAYRNVKSNKILFNVSYGKYNDVIIHLFAIVYTFMVAFANNKLWTIPNVLGDCGPKFILFYRILLMCIFFIGGYCAFSNIAIDIISNI